MIETLTLNVMFRLPKEGNMGKVNHLSRRILQHLSPP